MCHVSPGGTAATEKMVVFCQLQFFFINELGRVVSFAKKFGQPSDQRSSRSQEITHVMIIDIEHIHATKHHSKAYRNTKAEYNE
jgi:hypothetical protein